MNEMRGGSARSLYHLDVVLRPSSLSPLIYPLNIDKDPASVIVNVETFAEILRLRKCARDTSLDRRPSSRIRQDTPERALAAFQGPEKCESKTWGPPEKARRIRTTNTVKLWILSDSRHAKGYIPQVDLYACLTLDDSSVFTRYFANEPTPQLRGELHSRCLIDRGSAVLCIGPRRR